MPSIYPHLHDPEEHPNYGRRFVKATTRRDLGDRIQFTSLRIFSKDKDNNLINYSEDLDLYTSKFPIGRIIWPFCSTLFAGNVKGLIDEIARRGLWLFDFWGYVPGSDPGAPSWWQYSAPRDVVEYMEEKLGTRFIGLDNGEQDGRYIGGYAPMACPSHTDRFLQYVNFHRHFEKLGDDLCNRLTTLCSLNFGHYFAKEGNTFIIGAETGQALLNANLWYAYLRGAGKQYGLLWFGNASIWNRWGYKSYESSGASGGMSWGPDSGTSLSLLKRLLYSEYLYNSEILGFEQSWILGDNTEKRLEGLPTPMESDPSTKILTPVGELQVEAVRNVEAWGRPGAMHTPVAIVLSFENGWVPPRHLYSRQTHAVWGNLPYEEPDYQVHALFSMIFPGYEDSGFYRDERGFLTATPYGDIFDVLFSDVRAETLGAYNTAVLAGRHTVDPELFDKLSAFVLSGGCLVIFQSALGGLDERQLNFLGISSLPNTAMPEARIMAVSEGGSPSVLETARGEGSVVLVLSPYGITQTAPWPGEPIDNSTDRSLPLFYDFAPHVKELLGGLFEKQRIFAADNDNLMTVVNVLRCPDTFIVGVVNNTGVIQRTRLSCTIGEIGGVETLMGPGTRKGCLQDGRLDLELPPHEMAILRVSVGSAQVAVKAKVQYREPLTGIQCSLGHPISLKESLLALPTLPHYFDGVKVDARYLGSRDSCHIEKEGAYIRRQKISVTVDFSSMLNFYPELSLMDNIKGEYDRSLSEIRSILDKAARLGAKKAVISLHRCPENHFSGEQSEDALQRGVKDVCEAAGELGIDVYLRHAPYKLHQKPRDMAAFIGRVKQRFGIGNLFFAYDTGHALAVRSDIQEDLGPGGVLPDMLLISSPVVDGLGQLYDCHRPVRGSRFSEAIRKAVGTVMANGHGCTICIDVDPASWDAIYGDYSFMFNKG